MTCLLPMVVRGAFEKAQISKIPPNCPLFNSASSPACQMLHGLALPTPLIPAIPHCHPLPRRSGEVSALQVHELTHQAHAPWFPLLTAWDSLSPDLHSFVSCLSLCSNITSSERPSLTIPGPVSILPSPRHYYTPLCYFCSRVLTRI